MCWGLYHLEKNMCRPWHLCSTTVLLDLHMLSISNKCSPCDLDTALGHIAISMNCSALISAMVLVREAEMAVESCFTSCCVTLLVAACLFSARQVAEVPDLPAISLPISNFSLPTFSFSTPPPTTSITPKPRASATPVSPAKETVADKVGPHARNV